MATATWRFSAAALRAVPLGYFNAQNKKSTLLSFGDAPAA